MSKRRERSPEIGKRVKKLRDELGWSYSELARKSGVSRSYLYRIEAGKSSPTEDKLRSIANALGVSITDLLEGAKATAEIDMSETLRSFVLKENLPPADVEMLAKLKYRGKQPTTEEQWRILYRVIKATLENGS